MQPLVNTVVNSTLHKKMENFLTSFIIINVSRRKLFLGFKNFVQNMRGWLYGFECKVIKILVKLAFILRLLCHLKFIFDFRCQLYQRTLQVGHEGNRS
jgi:hypothetical protein